jgi:hypothetical protein
LVEAIHSALFLRSRVTGATQKAMLSEIHGGHPTVELLFEGGGKTYSITKVFSGGQSASTTLKEYSSSGSATAGAAAKTRHNEDAEARIHEILQAEDIGGGRNLDQRLKHQWAGLWVWQESATRDPLLSANSDRHAELLRERLSRIDEPTSGEVLLKGQRIDGKQVGIKLQPVEILTHAFQSRWVAVDGKQV